MLNEFLTHYPQQIQEIYALQHWANSNTTLLQHLPKEQAVTVTEEELKKVSTLATPNQVLALINKNRTPFPVVNNNEVVLMLDDIQDPGNMGTIIRIADWFGINKILCSEGCADIYNPKVIQSTMGSIMRVHVHYTHLVEWCNAHADLNYYGATLSGASIYHHKPLQAGVLIIGNESKGIQDALLAVCKEQITIPKIGEAESLNAAVATGILLSHLIEKK